MSSRNTSSRLRRPDDSPRGSTPCSEHQALTAHIQLAILSLAGAAVYLWHCDRDGNYSMYSSAALNQNYLRGEQVSDADGQVTALTGEFTLRGTSQPLRLRAQRYRCYTSPLLRREVCGGDFEATLQRSAYGMTYGLPGIPDSVKLVIQIEAVRQ